MLFKNGKVWCRIYYFKILVIVFINWAIKFIFFIDIIIYYKSSKNIINAIRFLFSILSFN